MPVAGFWAWLGLVTGIAGLAARLHRARHPSAELGRPGVPPSRERHRRGRGFVHPFPAIFRGHAREVPTALHPPLFPLLLAAVSKVLASSVDAHRVVSAVVGSATVFAMGLLGRRLLGDIEGLAVASLVAVYPNVWILDGLVMSETLFGLVIAPSCSWLPTRGEIVVVRSRPVGSARWLVSRALPRRGHPLVAAHARAADLLRSTISWRRRMAALALATVVVLACRHRGRCTTFPASNTRFSSRRRRWLAARPHQLRFATYHGDRVAYWYEGCHTTLRPTGYWDESVFRDRGSHEASAYVRRHLGELPRVLALRVARQWELFRPLQNARLATAYDNDHRSLGSAVLGLAAYYALVPIGVWGLVVMRRRGIALWPLVSLLVVVTATAALSYGTVRFRLPAELALIVASGAVITQVIAREPRSAPRDSPGAHVHG